MMKMIGKAFRFLAALLLGFSIAAELGWIQIIHPRLEQFHEVFLKAIKMLIYFSQVKDSASKLNLVIGKIPLSF